MKKISFWACVAMVATSAALPVQDAMKTPRLRDVRLKGVPAAKMNDLFRERLTGDFAKLNVFAEARRAFVDRDDDCKGHGGVWRGEFWGKQMLSAARVADYLADPAFTKFVREGMNELEVEVCDLWINRLVGDNDVAKRPTWTSIPCCGKGTKLVKSGLVGPVRLIME